MKENQKKPNGSKQKIVDGVTLIPPEKVLNDFKEDELCTACKCVAQREEVDNLHIETVYVSKYEDYDLRLITCKKCKESIQMELPLPASDFTAFPKAKIPETVFYYVARFLDRGLNPKDHIKMSVYEVPPGYDAEKACEEIEQRMSEGQRRPSQ